MSDESELIGKIRELLKCTRNEMDGEFEVRVGEFVSGEMDGEEDIKGGGGYHFKAGWDHAHFQGLSHLLESLRKQCEKNPARWQSENKIMFLKNDYGDNVLKIIESNKPSEPIVVRKTKNIRRIDIQTDRPYHVRVSLSREERLHVTENHPLYNKLNKEAPLSVRVGVRESFEETVRHEQYGWIVQWKYDITKMSPPGKTKEECARQQCRWHCEIELLTNLSSLSSKEEEVIQEEWVARMLLNRMKVILGTHVRTSEKDPMIRLLPPRFHILAYK